MADSLFKKLVEETTEMIEDLFMAFLGAALAVFMAGQFYGMAFAKTEAFWYPLWAFVIILVLKLLKDIFFKAVEEVED